MSEAKHTPGPWREYAGRITARDGTTVAITYQDTRSPDTVRANGELLAAAPDLLDALTGVLDAVPYSEEWREATFAARRAIARAEGAQGKEG